LPTARRARSPALAREFLGLCAVFGTDLPANPHFAGKVAGWLSALFADGAAHTVARAARWIHPFAQGCANDSAAPQS
jgi:hypothetical protein